MHAPVENSGETKVHRPSKYRDKKRNAPAVNYSLHFLRTDNTDEARAHNDAILGKDTFGIEVVLEALRTRCGRGNLDPQHVQGGGSSAIEHAMGIPLPGGDVKLVTIRIDKDSVGAMAVLMLRAQGLGYDIDKNLVAWVGALDQMGYQNAAVMHRELCEKMRDNPAPKVLNLVINHDERWPTLGSKVAAFKRALIGQILPHELRLYTDLANSRDPDTEFEYNIERFGRVGFLEAPKKYRRARDWLNRRYAVGVVFDPERETQSGGLQARWSVIRQMLPEKVFDRLGFVMAINEEEARVRGLSMADLVRQGLTWGGPDNIVTNPPGAGNGTFIPRKTIIELVRKHLESGIVS